MKITDLNRLLYIRNRIMNCENKQEPPVFTSEQSAEFSKLTLEFLKSHFPDEMIIDIKIEVKYSPLNKDSSELFAANQLVAAQLAANQLIASANCVIGPTVPGDPCAIIGKVWK